MVGSTQYLGKLLIIFGLIIIIVGVILFFSHKIPWIGKLPGDIIIQRKNLTFYFPLGTSILISLILTFLLWLFSKR
jgi:hypothetical protein